MQKPRFEFKAGVELIPEKESRMIFCNFLTDMVEVYISVFMNVPGFGRISRALIQGEPERALNTQETGSGVYYIYNIIIYLCMILHGNDLMHMPHV